MAFALIVLLICLQTYIFPLSCIVFLIETYSSPPCTRFHSVCRLLIDTRSYPTDMFDLSHLDPSHLPDMPQIVDVKSDNFSRQYVPYQTFPVDRHGKANEAAQRFENLAHVMML